MSRLPTFSHKRDLSTTQDTPPETIKTDQPALVQSTNTPQQQPQQDEHAQQILHLQSEISRIQEEKVIETSNIIEEHQQSINRIQSHNQTLVDTLNNTLNSKDTTINLYTLEKDSLDLKITELSTLIATQDEQKIQLAAERETLDRKVIEQTLLITSMNQQKINDASTNGYLLTQASLSQNAEVTKLRSKLKLAEASFLQMEQEKHTTRLENESLMRSANIKYEQLVTESKETLETELKESSESLMKSFYEVTKEKNQLALIIGDLNKESKEMQTEIEVLKLNRENSLKNLDEQLAESKLANVKSLMDVKEIHSIQTLALETEIQRFKVDIKSLNESNDCLTKKLLDQSTDFQSVQNTLKEELSKANEEKSIDQEMIKTLVNEALQLTEFISKLEAEKKLIDDKSSEDENAIKSDTAIDEIKILSEKLEESEQLALQSTREIKQLSSNNKTLELRIELLSSESQTTSDRLTLKNKQLAIELENLLLQSQLDNDTLEDTTHSLVDLRNILQLQEAKLARSELEKESLGELLRSRCEEADTEGLVDEIKELRVEEKVKNVMIQTLKDTLLKSEQSEIGLKQETGRLNQEIERIQRVVNETNVSLDVELKKGNDFVSLEKEMTDTICQLEEKMKSNFQQLNDYSIKINVLEEGILVKDQLITDLKNSQGSDESIGEDNAELLEQLANQKVLLLNASQTEHALQEALISTREECNSKDTLISTLNTDTQDTTIKIESLESEIIILRRSQCVLQDSIDMVKVDLEEVVLQLNGKDAFVVTLQASVKDLEASMENASEKLKFLSTQVDEKDIEIQSTKSKIDELMLIHFNETETLKSNHASEIETLSLTIESSTNELSIKSQEMDLLQLNLETNIAEGNAFKVTYQDLLLVKQELESQIASQETTHTRTLELAIADVVNERNLLESKLVESIVEKNALETKITELNTDMNTINSQLNATKQMLEDSNMGITDLFKGFGLDESQSMDAILNVYSEKCNALIVLKEEQSIKDNEYTTSLLALQINLEEMEVLSAKQSELLSQRQMREEEVEAQRVTLLEIQQDFANMVNDANRHNDSVKQYDALVIDLRSTIEQNESKIVELNVVIESQSVELNENVLLMRGIKDEFESCEAGLDSECVKLMEKIQVLETQAIKYDGVVKSLQSKVQEHKTAIESQRKVLKENINTIRALKDEFDSCEAGLDSECVKLMGKIQVLEVQVLGYEELANEKSILEKEMVDMRCELETSNDIVEKQSQEISQLKLDIEAINDDQSKQDLTTTRDALVAENLLTQNQLQILQISLTEKEAEFDLTASELDQLKIQYTNSQNTITVFESALMTAQKMLEDGQLANDNEIQKSATLFFQVEGLLSSQACNVVTIDGLETKLKSQLSDIESLGHDLDERKQSEKEKSSQIFDLIQAHDTTKALHSKSIKEYNDLKSTFEQVELSLKESIASAEILKANTIIELTKVKDENQLKVIESVQQLVVVQESFDNLTVLHSELIKKLRVTIEENETFELQAGCDQESLVTLKANSNSLTIDIENMQVEMNNLTSQIAEKDSLITESKSSVGEINALLAERTRLEFALLSNDKLLVENKALLIRALNDIESLSEQSINSGLEKDIELETLRAEVFTVKNQLKKDGDLLLNEKLQVERMTKENDEKIQELKDAFEIEMNAINDKCEKDINQLNSKNTKLNEELALLNNKQTSEVSPTNTTTDKTEEMSRLESIANDATDQLDQLNTKYHAKLQELKTLKSKNTKTEKAHAKMIDDCVCGPVPVGVKRKSLGNSDMMNEVRPSKRQSPQVKGKVERDRLANENDKENA